MKDLIAAPHEAARLELAKVYRRADRGHTVQLPCSVSARLLMSGGNGGPRGDSTLEVRKRAGPGLRQVRVNFGPAHDAAWSCCSLRASTARSAAPEAGLNRCDLGRYYNRTISVWALLLVPSME
jgi:hypothetical protein